MIRLKTEIPGEFCSSQMATFASGPPLKRTKVNESPVIDGKAQKTSKPGLD